DKMFLIKGTRKFALVDSGMGHGELQKYISQFTGGLPVEPIFTHNHFDHIGQADQFIRDSVEHIGEADRPAAEKLLKSRGIPDDVIAKNLLAAHDGDRIDLGDRSLVIYACPGHTPGSLVVFDEQTGNLFTGDSFGSNSPTIPDALWMQFTQTPLDVYLSTIKNCRANFSGKVKFLMTGHNDHPLEGETFLNNLQSAVQSLMDKGDSVLVPSYRPTGLQQVVVGDRFHDANWVAINVNKAHYLPAPVDKIAGLTRISVDGLKLSPVFTPAVKEYEVTVPHGASSLIVLAEPTSTRSSALRINGEAVKPAEQHKVPLTKSLSAVTIRVTSPDGTESAEYTVKLIKQ
ncbi:MAG TPA: MBL fold metallo-hydrolase, partial [Candidatus Acidoferrum sp.]|nr:MBL fold metallo-hydrolase [Candidatus Acidoferrum sp.]